MSIVPSTTYHTLSPTIAAGSPKWSGRSTTSLRTIGEPAARNMRTAPSGWPSTNRHGTVSSTRTTSTGLPLAARHAEQPAGVDVERGGDAPQRRDARARVAALDLAEERVGQIGRLGQLHERQALRLTPLPDPRTELQGFVVEHRARRSRRASSPVRRLRSSTGTGTRGHIVILSLSPAADKRPPDLVGKVLAELALAVTEQDTTLLRSTPSLPHRRRRRARSAARRARRRHARCCATAPLRCARSAASPRSPRRRAP